MSRREPVLEPVEIKHLRPTQMTVGLVEVEEKRREWRERKDGDAQAFLGRHMIPVIRGPHGRPFVIDHHHLVRALHAEGVEEIAVNVVADLNGLSKAEFWVFCDNRGWCHPYDDHGQRKGFDEIPKHISKLADDPFRSLSGALRRAGGYAKESTPFAEFTWADFLRRRIKRKLVEEDFATALSRALGLAKAQKAAHLPGWCGPCA